MRLAGHFLLAAWFCVSMVAVAGAQDPPRAPAETIKGFKVPEGFSVKLFAGEPDLVQPIGFCFDDRGRLWVAENQSYPKFSLQGQDRLVIYEDTDGDGHFDRKTVFYDKLNYLTGLEVGFGGVFVLSPPNLLFIPDKDGDDKPDGEPVVLLNGFGHQGVHNLVNGMVWGPDGWLYGGHGGTSSGWIGRPEMPAPDQTPATQDGNAGKPPTTRPMQFAPPASTEKGRIFFDGGVWRYHPIRRVFESVMEGTTNPWGLDFDDYGQGFISNSVTPHLYHVIMGAHVERRRESPNSRYAYGAIDTIADHKHWVGASWSDSRGGTNQQIALGGGHSHCGLMVYLGDAWPEKYRGGIFMNNIHGDRMNNDLPERRGSGYLARHGTDFWVSEDKWYMGLHIKAGPDGNVFVSDWYDTGECHTLKPNRETGRIYKIVYGGPSAPERDHPAGAFDVSKMSSDELAKLQLSRNEWWVRRARRVLEERGADPAARAALQAILRDNPDVTRRLRALWALHVTGGLGQELLLGLLKDPSEYMRGWAVTLLAEPRNAPVVVLAEFERLAGSDPSPWVRLQIVSALTRLPVEQRWGAMEKLVAHAEDAQDQNLPLMEWYALEPMTAADGRRALTLAAGAKIPKLREYVVRRMADSVK